MAVSILWPAKKISEVQIMPIFYYQILNYKTNK